MRKTVLIIICLLIVQLSYAQQDSIKENEDLMELNLEDLMKMSVDVASKMELSPQESPAIISILSESEIENSGATDLAEILKLIPGVQVEYDGQNVLSFSMRGKWAKEAKVLVMIDGLPLNENLLGSVQLGNHISANQIKRIEVQRGPGASLYGGFAALGVINIITKNGEDINGFDAKITYGQLLNTYSRRNIDLSIGNKKNDFEYAIHAFAGDHYRSGRDFVNASGKEFDMQKHNTGRIITGNINGNFSYKDWDFMVFYDNYNLNYPYAKNQQGDILSQPVNFDTYAAKISRDFFNKDNFKLNSTISHRMHRPFRDDDKSDSSVWNKTGNRLKGELTAYYVPNNNLHLISGVDYYYDRGQESSDFENAYWIDANNPDHSSFHNAGAYIQSFFKTKVVNIAASGRLDYHSEFGAAFAPRIGITKSFHNMYLKILYNRSYKAPTALNLAVSPALEPEIINSKEFEIGFSPLLDFMFSASFFDMGIKDQITYSSDQKKWINTREATQRGIELTAHHSSKIGYFHASYSYYTNDSPSHYSTVYRVPGETREMLGLTRNKFVLYSNFNWYKQGIKLSPSLIWLGKRFGYVYENEEFNVKEFNPTMLVNIFVQYPHFLVQRLHASAGIKNIFNHKFEYISASSNNESTLPGSGIEFRLSLRYDINW